MNQQTTTDQTQETYDIAIHVLERTRVAHDENTPLRKTSLGLLAHLRRFLDLYLAYKSFQGRGRKSSSEILGMGAPSKHSLRDSIVLEG